VLAALAVVIPLGLGGAVSPVMLTEQTMLLAGPDGGRAGARYAAGVVLTTFVIVVAIVLFGRAISLPTEPHLDASLAPSSPIMRSWPGRRTAPVARDSGSRKQLRAVELHVRAIFTVEPV
jgi:hypothetical protein